ncbi:MAG: MaoC family dehydratase [Sphingomonadales bacterium]
MAKTIDIAALEAKIGQQPPPSAWLTVTQDMIDKFAELTGDRQWIHIDVARCERESPFGAPVAHGLLILSLIPGLIGDAPVWAECSSGINYGSDKVRFMAPVRAGARIRAQQTLQSAAAVGGGGAKLVIAVTVEIEGEDKPACYAEMIGLLFP